MTTRDRSTAVIGFAHRGARAHAPENTIEAFVTACQMGADAVETDVWLTRDGVAVIDHDGVVRRGCFRRPIREFNVADLPPHMPTLAALQQAVGPHVGLSIDVKDPKATAAILAVRGLAGQPALRRTWLCDTDPERLASWRALDPHTPLVASIRRRGLKTWSPERLAGIGIGVLNLPHRHWSPSLVRRCHDAGLDTFAWGVQRPRRMRRLIAWGIDAIYSDHTDRMVAVLRAAAPQTDTPPRT